MIAHFYHAWVDGDWLGPVSGPADGHVTALKMAGLRPDLMVVGLVGASARRQGAKGWWRRADVADTVEFAEADVGYEQVTLRRLREWVAKTNTDTSVLYAHTKGAYNLSPITVKHREYMTAGVVGRWREAVAALAEHDVAGCFWEPNGPQPHFTGNFWWARAGYLAGLPGVSETDRYAAELWLGTRSPSVCELAKFSYAEMLEVIVGRAEPGEHAGTVMPAGVSMLGSVTSAPTIPFGHAERIG